mmetsp:Transcript_13164/g.23358  ORF Transcript_13164/g.23358 Transcript_13164/m.23358 type:complete len:899 (+) Transcript_13164:656-3352(+)
MAARSKTSPSRKSRTESLGSESTTPCLKLFIGGLSYDTTDESLQQYFSDYGDVESAVVLRDPTTMRSRGFGFVTFKEVSAANAVVSHVRHLIDGRKVEAKFAVPRAATTPTNANANANANANSSQGCADSTSPMLAPGKSSSASSTSNNSGNGASAKKRPVLAQSLSNSSSYASINKGLRQSPKSGPAHTPRSGSVSSTSSSLTGAGPRASFSSAPSLTGFAAVAASGGCNGVNAKGARSMHSKSSGTMSELGLSTRSDSFGSGEDFFVPGQLSSLEECVDMQKSMSFDGDATMATNARKAKSGTMASSRKQRSASSVSASGSCSGATSGGPNNGKANTLAGSSGIISNKIFVGGLLYATGHESLRSFFETYGQVETAEVIYNRDTKKSRGFGFVVFTHHESVSRVLEDQGNEMHVVDGKQVEVKRCVARQDSTGGSSAAGSSSHKSSAEGPATSSKAPGRSRAKRNQHVEEEKEREQQKDQNGEACSSGGSNQWSKKPTIITYSKSASNVLQDSGFTPASPMHQLHDDDSDYYSTLSLPDHLQQHQQQQQQHQQRPYLSMEHEAYSPMDMLQYQQQLSDQFEMSRHPSFTSSLHSGDFDHDEASFPDDESSSFRNERMGSSASTASSFFGSSFTSQTSPRLVDTQLGSPFHHAALSSRSSNQTPFGSLPSPASLGNRVNSLPALSLNSFHQGMLHSPSIRAGSPGPVPDSTGIWGTSSLSTPTHASHQQQQQQQQHRQQKLGLDLDDLPSSPAGHHQNHHHNIYDDRLEVDALAGLRLDDGLSPLCSPAHSAPRSSPIGTPVKGFHTQQQEQLKQQQQQQVQHHQLEQNQHYHPQQDRHYHQGTSHMQHQNEGQQHQLHSDVHEFVPSLPVEVGNVRFDSTSMFPTSHASNYSQFQE